MKKILTIALLLLPLVAIGQKSSLQLTISGMNAGTRLVVNELKEENIVPIDTVSLDAHGSIKLSYRIDSPYIIILTPEGARVPQLHCMLLPREKVTLNAHYDRENNFIFLNSVKGSENMTMYQKFTKLIAASMVDPSLQASLNNEIEHLVADNTHQLMSALLVTYFNNAFDQYAMLYKQVRDGLATTYSSHFLVRSISDRLARVVAVGMEAPEIEARDTADQPRRLSDLRGKVVLIDFWASWCGPCRMENPNVVRLYRKYHDMGFEIFSVSLDNDKTKWIDAIQKDHLEWPNHVSDLLGWRSAPGKTYGINAIPATVLVDRDGTILARNLRGEQLENKLKEIFGQ